MGNEQNNLYLHADGDSFFVACEISVNPKLRGLPVIVGEDRGIAVAMSPEAKKIGVTRGMPVFEIKKLFPDVIILPHHFELYAEISEKMKNILLSYFSKVEEYSIDECFAHVDRATVKYFGSEKKILTELKDEIEKTLNVTYSFGLARTKALAKQASKLEKPGGLVMLLSKAEEDNALKKTPIEDIWGIGRRTIPRLLKLGIKTAYDFAKYRDEKLEKEFSKPIMVLKKELNGEKILKIENLDPRSQKSLQSSSTFRPPSEDPLVIWREISENTERACENIRRIRMVSNKVSFFIKTKDFKYYFGEAKLKEYHADPGAILCAIKPQLKKILPRKEKIRSTGIILENLIKEENAPLDLFGHQEKILKNLIIEKTVDKIRKKYGDNSILHLSSLKNKPKRN